MVEILKQGQLQPLPIAKQVMIIYAGTSGLLDDLPVKAISKFETEFYKYMEKKYAHIEHEIEMKGELTDAIRQELEKAITYFKSEFKQDNAL